MQKEIEIMTNSVKEVQPHKTCLRVLIIDDNKTASDLLAEFLNSLGHVTKVVYSGVQALDVSLDYIPHVVITDIVLPTVNGFEVAKLLRQKLPIAPLLVALSGLPKDMHKENHSIFDIWLEKPVDLKILENLLTYA